MSIISKISKRSEADTIRKSLRLPVKSKEFVTAEKAWREAVASTNEARAEQLALSAKQSPSAPDMEAKAVRKRIEALQTHISELTASERAAKALLDHHRAEHAIAIRKAVRPVADHFAAATIAAIENLAELLRVGAELDERVGAEDVNISVPEFAAAPAANRLLDQYVAGQFKRWRS